MVQTLPFNDHVAEYEAWFERYPFVFQSEVFALKEVLPKGENLRGLEVGTGTGKFAHALGIQEGVEPADNMRRKAIKKGISVIDAEAEHLPFHDLSFDYVLMAFCISYFNSIHFAFKEAYRVLKPGGSLILGFLDRDSIIGNEYEAKRQSSTFYKEAIFYSPERIVIELKRSGYKNFVFYQTLFQGLSDIKELELPKPGFGEGSFVVIRSEKK
jgi:ubiquinone/menaquinone biosynthesis C-methylase UbiE